MFPVFIIIWIHTIHIYHMRLVFPGYLQRTLFMCYFFERNKEAFHIENKSL